MRDQDKDGILFLILAVLCIGGGAGGMLIDRPFPIVGVGLCLLGVFFAFAAMEAWR